MPLNTRTRTLLAKIESVYGTDPTPTGAANAILCKNLNVVPIENTMVARDNIKGYMGNDQQIAAACYAKVDFECELTGANTAGAAPAYGPLLRGCGMSETILATAQTGTAQAGAATTITLAAGASAVDNAYSGMTIRTIAGTGPGQYGVIKSYNGTTKVATMTATWGVTPDATTTYSVDAQVVYLPITSSIESVTQYFNVGGVLHKLTGARGNVSFSFPKLALPTMKFSFTGLYSAVADAAAPTLTLTGWGTPVAVNNTNTVRPVIMGYASSVLADLSVDLANSVVYRNLVGSESVLITDRKPAGSITQEATTVAAKDWWATIRAATLGTMSLTHGTVAGSIVKIDAPQMQIMSPTYEDMDGIQMLKTSATYIPSAGNDEISLSVK